MKGVKPLQSIDDLTELMRDDDEIAGFGQVLPLSRISPDPGQPRSDFSAESLARLAESISAQGVIQPIVVRPDMERPDDYIIVAGERRWLAAGKAGLSEIPAIVRELTNEQVRAVQLIENIDREPLTPIEEAAAVAALIDAGTRAADVATMLGKSKGWVSQRKKVAAAGDLLAPFTDRTSDIDTLAALVDLTKLDNTAFSALADGSIEPTRARVREALKQAKVHRGEGMPEPTTDPPPVDPPPVGAPAAPTPPTALETPTPNVPEAPPVGDPPPAKPTKPAAPAAPQDADESADDDLPDAAIAALESRMSEAAGCKVHIHVDQDTGHGVVEIETLSWDDLNRLAGLLQFRP